MPRHYNTRFNPTPSGNLHLGHVYLCLVNEYEAHSHGGKFYVRFDDTQRSWVHLRSDPATLSTYSANMRGDLEWLGIEVDEYILQSDIRGKVHSDLARIYGLRLPEESLGYGQAPIVKGLDCVPYPYTPPLVPEKVWMDFLYYCDYLIRGVDLITEFALYCHWAEYFKIHRVYHTYLPRLLTQDEKDPSYVGSISKTHGALTVRGFRERGWSKFELLDRLAHSCLKDQSEPWSVENIKERPIWTSSP